MQNYFFIVNPVSGRGKAKDIARRLKERLDELKVDYGWAYTERPWHAAELALKACGTFETCVVVGGDGTFNEVLNGVYGNKITIGLIPVGTGNDFVRSTHIPFNPDSALDVLLKGRKKKIDIGRANSRYFHNGLGIGFDAWVVLTSTHIHSLRGNALYLAAVLRTLLTYRPNPIEISFNGERLSDDFFMVSVGNGRSMGGGFLLTPDARIDDGLFDLCIIKNMSLMSILRNLLKVYSGRHKEDPRVSMERTRSLTIRSEQGFALHADGELLETQLKHLEVEIIPNALEIIC